MEGHHIPLSCGSIGHPVFYMELPCSTRNVLHQSHRSSRHPLHSIDLQHIDDPVAYERQSSRFLLLLSYNVLFTLMMSTSLSAAVYFRRLVYFDFDFFFRQRPVFLLLYFPLPQLFFVRLFADLRLVVDLRFVDLRFLVVDLRFLVAGAV